MNKLFVENWKFPFLCPYREDIFISDINDEFVSF